ncbi:HNH endonuclease [uncultured Mobiluncus sp.]|uniref:HNH endonuclease n=1 Tax=uncultured Mobiluncus sp. TaxID=293425 RepID=UPI00343D82EE
MSWGGRKVKDLARLAVSVYGLRCTYCKEPIDLAYSNEQLYGHNHPKRLSLEHLVPRSRGGTDSIENLRPCHLGCNAARGAKRRPRRATNGDATLLPAGIF